MNKDAMDVITTRAIDRAKLWQALSDREKTPDEKILLRRLDRLISRPDGKAAMVKLIDQSFRSKNPERVADQIQFIFKTHGIPNYFSAGDRLLVQLFLQVGRHFPRLSVPAIIARMRKDSSRSIISGHRPAFTRYLDKRKTEGVRLNINHLGEAVLGEGEARRHFETYLSDLNDPRIECISVKASSLYSQITPLAFDASLRILRERLEGLYRTAARCRYRSMDGRQVPKFVNLDMEGYRDVELTVAAFRAALELPELVDVSAGIALQAYLPDAAAIQETLTAWAEDRVRRGGAPIYLRIVKGANMEMERVESAIRNWPSPTFDNKLAVDANFKRMITFGMTGDRTRSVHLGIASHNLFDIAWAWELSLAERVADNVTFEMLEGMADHVRRAVQMDVGRMLLYAPVADRHNFISAIAYLVRRLDENTGSDNFLHHAPRLQAGSKAWRGLERQFLASLRSWDEIPGAPFRTQNRLAESPSESHRLSPDAPFTNEPDTDFSLSQNREWAGGIREKWKPGPETEAIEIPLAIAGEDVFSGRDTAGCPDPSRPNPSQPDPSQPEPSQAGEGKAAAPGPFARFALATEADAARAALTAADDSDGWRKKSGEERRRIFAEVARQLRIHRGDLMGAAAAETGKLFPESDPEVSEAIDFVEYYPRSADAFVRLPTISAQPKGVGLVIAPWNFPIAIPCGGITAALSAGNTVIFKPSSQAVLTGRELCRCFWDAGISKNTLQFIPCRGEAAAGTLTQRPEIDFIIFTGGTDTALNILSGRPDIRLAAETGGKNATIVTAMADRDQAILDVVHSAFSNSGQKCSATSLLILEKEVYDDPNFKARLVDAAESLPVGSAWAFETRMGPLIRPPSGKLLEALTRLLPGESWALKPRRRPENPYLWTPGIKWGVRPGSITHTTEFFGPLLGVMRAENLAEAVALANQTGYGLTAGLESLDAREQEYWKESLRAGNLYINRGTTGAVVLRQPFGGMGKSALGAGIKAGGPNYVSQFMDFSDAGPSPAGPIRHEHRLLHLIQDWEQKLRWGSWPVETGTDIERTLQAVKNYLHRHEDFAAETDFFNIRGQDNLLRYLPLGRVVVRLHEKDSLFEVLGRLAAAEIAGCRPEASLPPGLETSATEFLRGSEGIRFLDTIPLRTQTDEELAAVVSRKIRLRYAAPDRVPEQILRCAAAAGAYIARAPVLMEGRLEFLHYLQEQSICHNYHRYGNLGDRAPAFSGGA